MHHIEIYYFNELYKKVGNSINNINKLLGTVWCNGVNQLGIQQKGGIHSPLFLLKSLDIDYNADTS